MEKILKRDGKIVEFNSEKITSAIQKAAETTNEFDIQTARKLTRQVLEITKKLVEEKKDKLRIPSVEEIQDIVETVLLSSEYKKTAKNYILYREQHSRLRDFIQNANVDMVDDYLKKLDWQVRENSNMTYSIQGLNNYLASNLSKSYWLNKIYSKKVKEAHINGDIHIHDLNIVAGYCVGWDLKDLLNGGFRGVEGKVQSKAPKHFRTALMQMANFLYTMQGEAAGAQAFSNFDTLLAPYIKYDGISYNEVKQAMQEFIFNLNVPTRVGFQTPFTNITMDLTVPNYFKDEFVTIGGEIKEETYSNFQNEMNMINKAFFEIMMEGDATGQVFTFPIPTYNITKDFDFDNPELNGLWEMTAKYGVPYFSNFINSNMNPEDARSMCCRLRIDNRELEYRGGGLFGSNPLTGSIGVVTINLPKIGYLAKNEKEFFEMLKQKMDIAKESLEEKRKIIEHLTENGLYPYTKYYLRDIKKRFNKYWKNHFSTIGLIGANEACLNLLGVNIADKRGLEFANKIMDFMTDVIIDYKKETGNNYNLEASPAEGASYRLAKKDKENYPDIIVANEKEYKKGAKPFYTNSTQLPVNFTDDIFEALNLQDELQAKYTGGTVIHIFAGERIYDLDVMKNLVKKICTNYKLPYFTFTPTFSICKTHGYIAGEHFKCPKCNEETEVFSRVVGYIRPIKQWNDGKMEEFKTRKNFCVE
ncbi:TPA: ribonucleoside triphosphate reductase [Candidatus Galligastranaerophilus intestinigallinarum]|nr:ribonucleoside triphosphate reductase [Candidatus Galligastranaerophilus intestinigallinarum]